MCVDINTYKHRVHIFCVVSQVQFLVQFLDLFGVYVTVNVALFLFAFVQLLEIL